MAKKDFLINGTRLFKYCGDDPNVVIPNGVEVIEKEVFFNRNDIISVKMPNSVTMILDSAFRNCSKLKTIDFGGVKEIGINAFANCTSLTEISLPDSLVKINSFAFRGCKALKDVKFSANLEYIGKYVFNETEWINNQTDDVIYFGNCLYKCKDRTLKHYKVKDGTTSIMHGAFSRMSDLESIKLPDSLLYICEEAFSSCSSLVSISLPDSLKNIESWAFKQCSSLKSITVPGKVTALHEGIFASCTNLESIVLPASITYINGAFRECSSLKSFVFPDKVKSISSYTFFGCSSLESVTFNREIEDIPSDHMTHTIFQGCSALKELKVVEGNPHYRSEDNCIIDIENKKIVLGCAGSKLDNITSVTSIGRGAFGCSFIVKAVVPQGVTSIEESAFVSCPNLEEVVLPDGLTHIGRDAFKFCHALKINIPDSAVNLGMDIFRATEVTIYASKNHPIWDVLNEDHRRFIKNLGTV